jgi:hypothetical protein
METLAAGQRVRIIEFGPNDSWALPAANNEPSPLGSTGILIEVELCPLATQGYTTCVIHLDKPFMNYLVRMSFFEAKLERIEDNESDKNTCI